MSEYKPITYKIRERMEQAEHIIPIVDGAQNTQVRINLAWLTERLDEIDAIHAALEVECERLREQDHDGWVELPKDADGVPIRVGDIMKSPSGYVDMVEGILPDRYLVLRDGNWSTCRADWGFHYHASIVEDVLREFAMEVAGKECMTVRSGVVDKYAKRLMLAGDAS